MKRGLFIAFVFLFACNNEVKVLSSSEQLAYDIQVIDNFLDKNGITAIEDPSGLRYVIAEEGTGDSPLFSDEVTVRYQGILLSNNSIFDSNLNADLMDIQPFPINRLIQAWQIGLLKMKVGGLITLYVPSALGYGRNGVSGAIPPNAVLIFNIELISIN